MSRFWFHTTTFAGGETYFGNSGSILQSAFSRWSWTFCLILGAVFAPYAVQAQSERNGKLNEQAQKIIEQAGGTLTNINQSSSSIDMILGNPQNVEAINNIIGTNTTMAIEQIRAVTMPTLATTPGMRNLPFMLFETYANTAERKKQDVDKYLDTVDSIRALLRSDVETSLEQAYTSMGELMKYDIGGGTVESIRNRVRASIGTNDEISRINDEIKRLEIERGHKETLAGSFKTIPQSTQSASSVAGNSNVVVSTPQVDTGKFSQMLENAYKATRREEERLKAGALIGVKELDIIKRDVSARQDFRGFISTLVSSQQFLQAVLAIDFYQHIYRDGDYSTEMASMYQVSLEALKQSRDELEAFKYKYDNNELAGASERLLAAFMSSRNLPELLTVPRDRKRKVSVYLRNMSELESLLLVKDFGLAEGKIQEIRTEAPDFDFSKAMSLINTGKMRSNFALGMARLSAQQGKADEAQKYFYAAAELWPTNPELLTASQSFFTQADTKEKIVSEFDRYWIEENWRALYESRLKYAAVLSGDNARVSKFEAAMKKVEVAERALLTAGELRKAQNPAGAWETLEKARQQWTEDNKLNKMIAEVAEESPSFIRAIRNAQRFERNGQWAAALTWYLQAQAINPISDFAKEGIEQAQEKIFLTSVARQ